VTAPDKDHTCGTCGKTVHGHFCPICFAKWDPGSEAPGPPQYCFDCLEKHIETHKPDLTCVKIWKMEPAGYFRIEVGEHLCDQLCSDEALGVVAAWLMNGASKDGIHRFLRTREQERQRERANTERYIKHLTGDTAP
jgi:hypothetical protein